MLNSSGKLFGKINVIDFSLAFFLVLVALGLIAVQSGFHRTSGQMIEGETDLEYVVFLRHVQALDPQGIFKAGEKVSISIRNRPRGKVEILEVLYKPEQLILPTDKGKYQVLTDPTAPNSYDFLLKLKDHALITKDSYVTNGVKVKTGMKLTLEGFNFRLPGIISDVRKVNYTVDNKTGSPSSRPEKSVSKKKTD